MWSDEARVRFNDLQLAIAKVALELHVADTLETNALEEFLALLSHFRKPFTDVIAPATPIHWKASDGALGEVKEAVPGGINEGIVACQQIVRARYHLHDHDFHAMFVGQADFLHNLVKAILDDEELAAKDSAEFMTVDWLHHDREADFISDSFDVSCIPDSPGVGSRNIRFASQC